MARRLRPIRWKMRRCAWPCVTAWSAGAKDVAAAISWVHQNADLFKGDARAIIAVGWSVGAFHLATYLAHKEFQEADNYIAGTVLVSGIYRADADHGEGAKS